jgi:uncharacterized coiled-coil DUF342 family protein
MLDWRTALSSTYHQLAAFHGETTDLIKRMEDKMEDRVNKVIESIRQRDSVSSEVEELRSLVGTLTNERNRLIQERDEVTHEREGMYHKLYLCHDKSTCIRL